MKKLSLFFSLAILMFSCRAQFFASQKTRDSIYRLSAQDHLRMMKLLHIDSLRPGADGNHPNAPNAANTDEHKANPYLELPDPLVANDSEKMTTPEEWWSKRRPEIVEEFDQEVYGRTPEHTPKVNWKLVSVKEEMQGRFPVSTKELLGVVDNSADTAIHVNIQLTLSTPADVKRPVPVVMELGFVFPKGFTMPKDKSDTLPPWQQQLLQKGWGYAVYVPTSVQPDNGAGLTQGIIGLVNKGRPRSRPDEWGALKAWAWGASCVLDYFETDKTVDAKHVAIEGLSRYGKAALVAMAYDRRFAIGFIGSSGRGGAALLRRNFGEQVENLASSGEYHWMCGNFLKYAGPLTPENLPVDAHELIALCAPRPVFISCGSPKVEGNWVDDKGQFMAAVAAGPVYRLLGKKGLGAAEMPLMGKALLSGAIGFRQHFGAHTVTPNWPVFIRFADKYFP